MSDIKLVQDAYGRYKPVKAEDLFEYGIKPDGSTLGNSTRSIIVDVNATDLVTAHIAGSPYVSLFTPEPGEYATDFQIVDYTFTDNLYIYITP